MAAEASKQDLPPETDVCGTWLEYTDRNCSRQLGVFDRFDWTEEIFESFAGRVIEVHRELRADNKGYQMLSIHDLETTNQAHDWLKPVIDSGAVVPGAAGPSSSVSAPTTPTSGGAGTGPANTTVSDEGKVLILCLGKEWQKGRNLVSQLARVDMQKASRGRNFRADLSRFYGPELPTPEGATLPIATCRSLGWRWKYHLEALNIWIVDWLYFPATKTTLVVLRRDATVTWRETRYLFECFFSQYRAFRLANPLVFGLIILKRLEWINQRIMESRINDINDVLRQTGFHGFRNLEVNNKTLTRKDLSTLTAKVLTTGTMLDCLIGDIKTFQEHDIMMKREIEEWRRDSRAGRGNYAGRPSSSSSASASGTPPPDNNMALVKAKTPVAALPLTVVEEEASDENLSSYLLEECDAVWRLRRGVENIGMDYEGRARLLLTALQSMITQQDQKLTISLAQASWKDTTSMTAITIITMVFLPGTFMSTLFSIPFFTELAAGGDPWSQLKAFAAVTIPLTVVVFFIWFFWMRRREKVNKITMLIRELEDGRTIRRRRTGEMMDPDEESDKPKESWYGGLWTSTKAGASWVGDKVKGLGKKGKAAGSDDENEKSVTSSNNVGK